jgi:Gram-negative bacterial TonB protein C-terminal
MQMIFSILLFAASLAAAQEGNPPKSEPCVAPGETIYQPGIDHVKPPELIPEHKKGNEPSPSRRQVTLEVLLNSQGAVCEVHIMRTSNVENAKKVADDVAQNFKFKPATRYNKAVAVKMLMNFNLHE